MTNLLVPQLIHGLSWESAKSLLIQQYDLEIDETDDLFSVKYRHGTSMWTKGTAEQVTVLRESRGTIFTKQQDTSGYIQCVCYPFEKFWNYNEVVPNESVTAATTVFRNSSDIIQVQEKYDGHLLKLYYYKDEWRVSSNSKIDTQKPRDKYPNKSNYELFMEAAVCSDLDFSRLNKSHAYFFERLHPECAMVVQVKSPKLYHIGTRNCVTLMEVDEDIGVPKPQTTDLTTLQDCIDFADKLHFTAGEGLVVCNKSYRPYGRDYARIKIKSRSYLMVFNQTIGSRVKDDLGFCLDIWLRQEASEYLSYFPQYIELYQGIDRTIYQIVIPRLNDMTDPVVAIGRTCSRREFFQELDKRFPKDSNALERKLLRVISIERSQNDGGSVIVDVLRQRNHVNRNKFNFRDYLHRHLSSLID
ncbi:hypothetical protein BKA69DRAFT_1037232 [Paraphysoderma sedebokerense]|nr:hypothetical protein BKA69DRAFT_1037232 [Paraphysoderma sedebokerense]